MPPHTFAGAHIGKPTKTTILFALVTAVYMRFLDINILGPINIGMFYFLGEMKTFKDPVLVRRIQSKDSVVSFNFKLFIPLRDDLYDYFTRDKI